MIINFLSNAHIIFTICGVVVIILLGALAWAMQQIYRFLDDQFVRKLQCERCLSVVKNDFHDRMEEQYQTVSLKIENIREEFSREMRLIRDIGDKRNETIIRIETKLDLLLQDNLKSEK